LSVLIAPAGPAFFLILRLCGPLWSPNPVVNFLLHGPKPLETATHGIVDSLYIRELAKKVHRGVEGLALRGLHTGGRCFGYRSIPVEDSTTKVDTYGRPLITGVRLEIDENQAVTVR
jgi:hypothetical protein